MADLMFILENNLDPGTGSNQLPSVSVTSPAQSTTFTDGDDIIITASASDSDGTISSVEFFAGTTSLGTDTAAPYTITWTGVSQGSYSLTAVAIDNEGGQTTSSAVSITVDSVTPPGCVAFYPGTTLDGWTEAGPSNHGNGANWTLNQASGAIQGSQNPGQNGGFLLTDAEFGDFEVSFEVRATFGVDTGFMLRTQEDTAADNVAGYQVTIDMQDDSSIAGIYGEGFDNNLRDWNFLFDGDESNIRLVGGGDGFNEITPSIWSQGQSPVWDVGNFNTITARIEGNPPTIQTWINGRQS